MCTDRQLQVWCCSHKGQVSETHVSLKGEAGRCGGGGWGGWAEGGKAQAMGGVYSSTVPTKSRRTSASLTNETKHHRFPHSPAVSHELRASTLKRWSLLPATCLQQHEQQRTHQRWKINARHVWLCRYRIEGILGLLHEKPYGSRMQQLGCLYQEAGVMHSHNSFLGLPAHT